MKFDKFDANNGSICIPMVRMVNMIALMHQAPMKKWDFPVYSLR